MTEQIMNVINEIALKLGVAAEKVLPMLLKQAEVFKATYQVGLWVLGISAFVMIVAFVLAIIDNYAWRKDIVPIFAAIAIVSGLICFTAGMVLLPNLPSYSGAVHNPEWWAIEYVTNLLK